jgi:hypothetical protein
MPEPLRVAALESVASTPALLRVLVETLPAKVLAQPADGDWSPHDVAAHLLLTNRIGAFARIRTIVAEDEPALLNHDEEEELRRSGLRERPVAEIVDEFGTRRAEDVAWLRTLDDAAYARVGHHSVAGRVTAEEFLFHGAYHDMLHLAQLARMIGAAFEPLRGGMHMF